MRFIVEKRNFYPDEYYFWIKIKVIITPIDIFEISFSVDYRDKYINLSNLYKSLTKDCNYEKWRSSLSTLRFIEEYSRLHSNSRGDAIDRLYGCKHTGSIDELNGEYEHPCLISQMFNSISPTFQVISRELTDNILNEIENSSRVAKLINETLFKLIPDIIVSNDGSIYSPSKKLRVIFQFEDEKWEKIEKDDSEFRIVIDCSKGESYKMTLGNLIYITLDNFNENIVRQLVHIEEPEPEDIDFESLDETIADITHFLESIVIDD